jgi:hypothetical protein
MPAGSSVFSPSCSCAVDWQRCRNLHQAGPGTEDRWAPQLRRFAKPATVDGLQASQQLRYGSKCPHGVIVPQAGVFAPHLLPICSPNFRRTYCHLIPVSSHNQIWDFVIWDFVGNARKDLSKIKDSCTRPRITGKENPLPQAKNLPAVRRLEQPSSEGPQESSTLVPKPSDPEYKRILEIAARTVVVGVVGERRPPVARSGKFSCVPAPTNEEYCTRMR